MYGQVKRYGKRLHITFLDFKKNEFVPINMSVGLEKDLRKQGLCN